MTNIYDYGINSILGFAVHVLIKILLPFEKRTTTL